VCIKYGVNKSKQTVIPPQAKELELEEEEWAFLRRINWQYMYWSPQHDLTWCKVGLPMAYQLPVHVLSP
jgi:hypothetical protein